MEDDAPGVVDGSLERLPILDLARDDEELSRALDAACRDTGFFYVVRHGVSGELLRAVFAQTVRFHALPLSVKRGLSINSFHRGYIGAESYRLDAELAPNLSESLVLMHELPPEDPRLIAGRPLQGPNQWPELAGFRDTMLAYVGAMEEVGRRLLGLFALGLELPIGYFQPSFARPTTFVRLLHYPPQPEHAPSNQFGSAPHTDYGAITLLAQDDAGGLQVRHRSGDWLKAPPIPGAFIVNIGDVMARWTNHRYVSTPHRVINTSKGDRFSIPFFFDPDMDVEIECLESCRPADEPPRYEGIRYGDYLMARLNTHYAYRNAGAKPV